MLGPHAHQVCSYDAAKRMYEAIPEQDKEFKSYDGYYHEVRSCSLA